MTYRVKGTAEEVILTYRNAQGETEQTTIRIPIDSTWSVSFAPLRVSVHRDHPDRSIVITRRVGHPAP